MLSRLTIAFSVAVSVAGAAAAQTPQAALDELLSAERKLSQAAEKLSPADGIASLLASDGVLFTRPAPVTGPVAAAAALKANPANNGRFAQWHSIRAGVSADGQHGFTLGYLNIDGGDPGRAKRRYLAYWVKGANGWRVAALKQALQAEKETLVATQPPALPATLKAADKDKVAEHAKTLAAAEKAFSDRAQVVGLTQAFQEFGRPDAIHIFGVDSFTVGLGAIRASHEQQEKQAGSGPTPINWSADTTIVASSGDLGVSIGRIRQNKPDPASPEGNPFFTIWMRDDPSQPWRYVAE